MPAPGTLFCMWNLVISNNSRSWRPYKKKYPRILYEEIGYSFKIFYTLQIQKRIVSAESICGDTIYLLHTLYLHQLLGSCSFLKNIIYKSEIISNLHWVLALHCFRIRHTWDPCKSHNGIKDRSHHISRSTVTLSIGIN